MRCIVLSVLPRVNLYDNIVRVEYLYKYVHEKNGFAERSKILAAYRSMILLNYQNNYAQTSC